eukprot:tig00001085_g6971.t1
MTPSRGPALVRALAALLLLPALAAAATAINAYDVPQLIRAEDIIRMLPGWEDKSPPIPVLGVVAYRGGEYLLRCVRSIDHPVRRLVLLINGEDGDVARAVETLQAERPGARVLRRPENLGVSGSWNEILEQEGADGEGPPYYWVMAASDSKFAPGTLRRLATMMGALEGAGMRPPHIVHFADARGGCQFHTSWALSRLGRHALGTFDANYHPYGGEDSDWEHRRRLAGIPLQACRARGGAGSRADTPQVFVDLVTVHGPEGAETYVSGTYTAEGAVQRSAFRRQQARQEHIAYFLAKWGDGPFPAGLYASPFDDDAAAPGDWALHAPRRRYVETGSVHLDGTPLPPAIPADAWPHDGEALFGGGADECGGAGPAGAPRVLFVQASVVAGFFPPHHILFSERARELGVSGAPASSSARR